MKPKTRSELHSENRFGQPASISNEVIEPVGQFYEGCFKCAAEINAEAASFVCHRMEEDMKLPQQFAQCQNPIEVYNTQIGFYMHMMDDYIREGQKMLDMARSITMNGGITSNNPTSSPKATNGAED